MPRAFSIKKRHLYLPVLILSFCLASCGKKQPETFYTVSEWLMKLCDQAGITEYTQEKPYFLNIPEEDPLFACVQAAVEWDVLDTAYAVEPGAILTKEFAAYTLMNLRGLHQNAEASVKDLQKCEYRKQVAEAVASGLMKTDERGLFEPDKILSREEADAYLETVIRAINDPVLENTMDISLKKDVSISTIDVTSYDPDTGIIEAAFAQNFKPGDYVSFLYEGEEMIRRITSSEGNTLHTADVLPEEVYDTIEMQGETTIDPEKAEITSGDGRLIQEGSWRYHGASHPVHTASRATKRTFEIHGYTVSLYITSTGIRAEAVKTKQSGAEVFAMLRIDDILVKYRFSKDSESRYMKVSFDTEEDFGIRDSRAEKLKGDFSSLSASAFAAKLSGFFKDSKDAADDTFTLCTIRIPIAGNPALTANMKLDLELSASGTAKIVLTQESEAGFECRNGKTRMIRSFKHDEGAEASAGMRAAAGIGVSLDLLRQNLMDVHVTAGANTDVTTTLHLYENDEKHEQKMSVSSETASILADGNPDVLVCADMQANWILDIRVNSSASLAGRMGLGHTFSILNEKNNTIIPSLCGHFENGHKVAACTRRNRILLDSFEEVRTAGKICLDTYSMIVRTGESRPLIISALPEGYTKDDLRYTSSSSCASVNAQGNVTAHTSGSAKISICTSDEKHCAYCSILVPQDET